MATYVNDLRLKEIATGDESGTWGTSTNTNLELIAEAFSFGTEAITTNADTHTTTIADGSTDPGRSIYLKYTGTLDSACTITIGPNTVSKLWFIENGTSGSQNIIISQGSGANVTIPPGDTKAIYSDGAGSGAAMVDAFASLNVVDLKVEDDLTVTDDLIVNGDIDLEGSIDVNGTANLDVVDIDGAVDMASTLAVGGAVTANAGVVIDNITIDGTEIDLSSGDLTLDSAGDIILDADGADILLKDAGTTFGELTNSSTDFVIKSTTSDKDIIFKGNDGGSAITALTLDMSAAGAATFNDKITAVGTSVFTNLDISGDIDVDGTTNLDVVDIDGAVDMATTLAVGGAATFGGDITISEATPTITFTDTDNNYDATIAGLSGSLILTADANAEFGTETIQFHTGGSQRAQFNAGGRFLIGSTTSITAASGQNPFSQVIGTDASSSSFSLNRFSNNDASATLFFVKSRNGTPGSNTIVQSNDTIGSIDFKMDDGTNYQTQVARIMAKIDGTPGENDAPGRLTFHTTADGAATVTERMRIDSSGQVGVGVTSPANLLHVVGSGSTPFATQRNVNSGAYAMIQGKMGDSASTSAGHVYSALVAGIEDNTNGAEDGFFAVEVSEGGSSSEKLRVTSSGALGLGTTSPSVALHTVGKVRAQKSGQTSAYVQLSADDVTSNYAADIFVNDTGLTFKHNSNGRGFVFDQNGTERMRITSAGKVGIGTASPDDELHISDTSGNAVVQIEASASGFSQISLGDVNDGDVGKIKYDHSDNSISFTTDTSERMRINSSGRLGLGTSSPTGLLEISGGDGAGTLNIVSTTNSSGSGNKIAFFAANRSDTDEEMAFIKPLLTSNSGGSGNVQTGQLTFGTSGSERGRFDASGNLGLGTTSPTDKLEIAAANSQVRLTDTDDSKFLQFSYSGGNLITRNNSTSTEVNQFTLTEDGKFGVGTINPSAALHVKSNGGIARLESTSATGNNYLSFYDSSALKGHVGYTGSSDDDFNIFQNESANLKFFTAGSEAARFDSSQNFLVGNTSTNLSSSAFGTVLFSSGRTVHSRNVDGGASAMQIFGNAGECRIMGDGDIQ